MIHQLLSLTRPLFVIDTETTGTDTQEDRIVELGFQQWDATGMVKEWRSLINPLMSIPQEVVDIHHITDYMMTLCRKCTKPKDRHPTYPGNVTLNPLECSEFHPIPSFAQLAANLAKGLSDCDFAGKRVRFDLQILASSFVRAQVPWSYLDARIIDADKLEQIAEPRHLSDLHRKYTGHEHEGAHGALSDVRASITVIEEQLKRYEQIPRDLDALHRLQWPDFIDPEGKFRFKNGVPCVGRWGKHKEKPMEKVPIDYWDWIIQSDFAAEIKDLARNAKLRKFPEARR